MLILMEHPRQPMNRFVTCGGACQMRSFPGRFPVLPATWPKYRRRLSSLRADITWSAVRRIFGETRIKSSLTGIGASRRRWCAIIIVSARRNFGKSLGTYSSAKQLLIKCREVVLFTTCHIGSHRGNSGRNKLIKRIHVQSCRAIYPAPAK